MILLAVLPRNHAYRRIRTQREDGLHDQIQQAMNWSPEKFYLEEDGKYRNAYGQEGVCMTLEELMEMDEKGNK